MSYYIAILKPVNKNIAPHIIDGDNWEAITGLCCDISCIDNDHDCEQFTKDEVQKIASTLQEFLSSMCYIRNGKTYMNDGDNQIYGAKCARSMLTFLKECGGCNIKYISVNKQIVDDYD